MYTPSPSSSHDVFTVSQLNQRARQLLEISFSQIKVEGEISNLSRPASGHWYFTLKDQGAQIRCAMFRSRTAQLRFQPKEGDQVIVRGKVSLYENRGDFQLIADAMKPAGEGALQQAFIELKQKLGAEGLFAQELKKSIPSSPATVAVITSPTGAAVHDILTVLKRRFPAIEVDIYPVQVQGNESAGQLINALHQAQGDQRADVILIGRGGGSIEDLWSFNDEQLARAIRASTIPVISAVGHETDFTIADFVADARAPTPSAAAEMISPDREFYLQHFGTLENRMTSALRQLLQNKQWQLSNARQKLRHPGDTLLQHSQRLDMLEIRMQKAIENLQNRMKERLQKTEQRFQAQNPQHRIAAFRKDHEFLSQRLSRAMLDTVQDRKARLHNAAQVLHAVSPLQTLGRGYSILKQSGETVVSSVTGIKPGDRLSAALTDGTLELDVAAVHSENG